MALPLPKPKENRIPLVRDTVSANPLAGFGLPSLALGQLPAPKPGGPRVRLAAAPVGRTVAIHLGRLPQVKHDPVVQFISPVLGLFQVILDHLSISYQAVVFGAPKEKPVDVDPATAPANKTEIVPVNLPGQGLATLPAPLGVAHDPFPEGFFLLGEFPVVLLVVRLWWTIVAVLGHLVGGLLADRAKFLKVVRSAQLPAILAEVAVLPGPGIKNRLSLSGRSGFILDLFPVLALGESSERLIWETYPLDQFVTGAGVAPRMFIEATLDPYQAPVVIAGFVAVEAEFRYWLAFGPGGGCGGRFGGIANLGSHGVKFTSSLWSCSQHYLWHLALGVLSTGGLSYILHLILPYLITFHNRFSLNILFSFY